MAQKPYKHNIEYIQKFYSHGSEAKVVEFKPVYQENKRKALPKREKDPVTTVFIDPVALCGVLVAVVMLLVMLAGVIQFNILSEDLQILENYVTTIREENVLLKHSYNAGFDLQQMKDTAVSLGMIPIEDAETISMSVTVPQRPGEPTVWDDMVWFLSGLFE